MLSFERYILGEMGTNCYLVWDKTTGEGAVIDPADEGGLIAEEIERKKIKLKYILATHGHFDHLLGALELKLIFGAPFGCSSKDRFLLDRQKETARFFLGREIEVPNFKKIDIDLDQEPKLSIGKQKIKVIKTPGHTPGGVSFLIDKFLFSGDTLFENGVGRTDLSYSCQADLEENIKKLKAILKSGVTLLPGHETG